MINVKDKNQERQIRHKRVRKTVSGTAKRPRLCVNRSLTNIYAQLIDDVKGVTLLACSTREKEIAEKVAGKRATQKKIKHVVFDRGGYLYTGRVQALADGARSAGLEF